MHCLPTLLSKVRLARSMFLPAIAHMTGRFTYDWSITGKTLLSGSVWREIGTVTDTTSTFSLTKGSSLDVSWVPTSKISVRGGVAYRSSDFQSESGFVLGVVDKRKDDIRTASAALGYSPLQNTSFAGRYY